MNPFIIESAVIAHLSTQIVGVDDIGSYAKYQSRMDTRECPPVPAIYVMPGGSEVEVSSPDETRGFDVEEQVWWVNIHVDHSPDEDDVDTTAIRAGAIIEQVSAALVGWRPEYNGSRLKGYKPFRYAGRADPLYAPGFGEFPVMFKTGLVLTGNF